eukprot:scaffold2553_cov138-Cylindrotheca_fusiformis.AAC.12
MNFLQSEQTTVIISHLSCHPPQHNRSHHKEGYLRRRVVHASMTLPAVLVLSMMASVSMSKENNSWKWQRSLRHTIEVDAVNDGNIRKDEQLLSTAAVYNGDWSVHVVGPLLMVMAVLQFLRVWRKWGSTTTSSEGAKETEAECVHTQHGIEQGNSSHRRPVVKYRSDAARNYFHPSDGVVVEDSNYGDETWGSMEHHTAIQVFAQQSTPAPWLSRIGKQWMSLLDDDVPLSSISIPGSHDAGSRYGGMYVATQSWTLIDQLRSGIRYLDIRCRREAGRCRLSIYHGFVYQRIDMDDVLQTVQCFLQQHPTEIVLMRVKEECKPKEEKNTKSFSTIWNWYMQQSCSNGTTYGAMMARNMGDDGWRTATLGSVRGKVIVFRDDLKIDPSYGIKYRDNSKMDVQDYYALQGLHGMSKKKALIKAYMEKANHNKNKKNNNNMLIINHCSATQIPIFTPSYVAKRTNKTAYYNILTSHWHKTVGILVMDFPGDHLIFRILLSNFLLSPEKEKEVEEATFAQQL